MVVHAFEEAGEVGALVTRPHEIDEAEGQDRAGAGCAPRDDVARSDAATGQHHPGQPERGHHRQYPTDVAAEHRQAVEQDAGDEDRRSRRTARAGPGCPRTR